MSNYQLKNDEVILFEGQVTYKEIKSEVKFILTNKKMVIEKEKGLFKKKFKLIDTILLDDIKIFKNDVQVKNNKEEVLIQTIEKNITFICSDISEAKKIVGEIIDIKTDSNSYERGKNKVKKTLSVINDGMEILEKASPIIMAIAGYFINKKKKG